MSSAAIAANFYQTFNVEGFLTAEVAFHLVISVDNLTNFRNFAFGQIANTGIGIDTGLCQDLTGSGKTDTENIGQRIFYTLIIR